MVTKNNFRGVLIESWPIKELNHKIVIPKTIFPWIINPAVSKTNLNGKMDVQLFDELRQVIDWTNRASELEIDVKINCDRIEVHTAQFVISEGREYLLKHPLLRSNHAADQSVYWRSVYLVRNGIKYPIIRTNWRVIETYSVTPDREILHNPKVTKEVMQNVVRHPTFLPMNSETNAAFLWRATNAIVPVEDAYWPDFGFSAHGIRETRDCLTGDFVAMGASDAFDLHQALTEFLGRDDYPQELRIHSRVDYRGGNLRKRIQRLYNQPVFAVRGSAHQNWAQMVQTGQSVEFLADTWVFVTPNDPDKFIPKAAVEMQHTPVVMKDDGIAFHFVDEWELSYRHNGRIPHEPSARLEELFSAGKDRGWREAVNVTKTKLGL